MHKHGLVRMKMMCFFKNKKWNSNTVHRKMGKDNIVHELRRKIEYALLSLLI